jgi:LacI family transcriptional regulator
VNIYDIAKIANVSVTTVSRVINNKDGVGAKTRLRIKKIIDENNFNPSIVKNNNDTIAIVIATQQGVNPINSGYLYGLLEGICEIAFNNNFGFMVISYKRLPDDYNDFFMKHNICSAIFVNMPVGDNSLVSQKFKIPVAVIGSDYETDKIACVKSNSFLGSYKAVEYLIKMGHSKISFFVSSLMYEDHVERLNGYKKALEDHNIKANDDLIIKYDYENFTITDLELMIDNLFSIESDAPTAIFACDDNEAYKIASILKKKNISIPKDVSLVGFDDYNMSIHYLPPLTTVRQPLSSMGRAATEAIISAMKNDGKISQNKYYFENSLIIRKSVKQLN